MRVKLFLEVENHGAAKTSLEPTLRFKAYDTERNPVSYHFKILNEGIRRINHISASSAMHIIPLKLSLAPVLDGIWSL